jgi:hypothetical protein
MIGDDVNDQLKNLDARVARIEQFLPSVATKDDLKALATKDDLKAFATKDDLKAFAAKDDLKAFATKEELSEEGERTRRHMDIVAEALRDDLKIALEGNMALTSRVESLEQRHGRLERRVTVLEATGTKRRK